MNINDGIMIGKKYGLFGKPQNKTIINHPKSPSKDAINHPQMVGLLVGLPH
jgi:hypothetical protein